MKGKKGRNKESRTDDNNNNNKKKKKKEIKIKTSHPFIEFLWQPGSNVGSEGVRVADVLIDGVALAAEPRTDASSPFVCIPESTKCRV